MNIFPALGHVNILFSTYMALVIYMYPTNTH